MIVTINTSSFGQQDNTPLEILKAKGINPLLNPYKKAMTADQVVEFCSNAQAIIAGTEPLSAQVLSKLTQLKVISRCGTGMDNVDIDAAKAQGIAVYNTPSGPTLAVAELTVGLILSLLRRVHEMDRQMHAGVWEKKMGNLLSGKTVGIIGFGRIGQKLGEFLSVFGVSILYVDLFEKQTKYVAKKVPLNELLVQSDIVAVHLSSSENKPVMAKNDFFLMKKGSLILNLSRGNAIDEDGLYEALQQGHLAGAALDVFGQEPYTGRLNTLNQVILTPHIGSYAAEARVLMEIESVNNLLKGMHLI